MSQRRAETLICYIASTGNAETEVGPWSDETSAWWFHHSVAIASISMYRLLWTVETSVECCLRGLVGDTGPRNWCGTRNQPRVMGQLTRALIGDTSECVDIVDIAEGRRGM